MNYVRETGTGRFRPDRRVAQSKLVGVERRTSDPVITTSEQYDFLRDCFKQKEATYGAICKGERHARHFVVATAMAFAVIYFAAPNFTFSLEKLGLSQDFTLTQVAAIAPLLISYFIVHACILGLRRLRCGQECSVIDAELQRFGETGYSLLNRFRKECESREGRYRDYFAPKYYRTINGFHDAFLIASGAFAMAGSINIAIDAYWPLADEHKFAAVGFFAFLLLAAVASVIPPILFREVREQKKRSLSAYLDGLKVEQHGCND